MVNKNINKDENLNKDDLFKKNLNKDDMKNKNLNKDGLINKKLNNDNLFDENNNKGGSLNKNLNKNDLQNENLNKNDLFNKNDNKPDLLNKNNNKHDLLNKNKIKHDLINKNVENINNKLNINKKIIKNNLINNNLINKKKKIIKNVNKNNYINKSKSTKSVIGIKSKDKLNQLSTESNPDFGLNQITTLNDFNYLDDYELNNLSYEEALKLDKRTFIQIYCSMLRKKHIIMFIFCTRGDYNLSILKVSKLVFLLATNFAMSVLFFFDDSMHNIYINSKGFNFIQQIPQIIYSSLVSAFFEFLISFLILSEVEIHDLKEKKKMKNPGYLLEVSDALNCIKIKFIIYFIFSFGLLILYWYFVSSFCAVYENTQIIFIEDSLTGFALSLAYPLLKYILFTMCRLIPLRCNQKNNCCKLLYKIGMF